MKIAIYGGTFNPIHNGHIEIANDAIKNLELDQIIFVPTFQSPFKKKQKINNVEDRLAMLQLVIKSPMTVSEFETKKKGVSFTYETVNYFKHQFPNDQLYLIIGDDQLARLHKWRKIDKICNQVKIVIYPRIKPIKHLNIKKYHCLMMPKQVNKASSTLIRQGHFSNLNNKVIQYIGNHFLYHQEILHQFLDAKTNKHCHEVAKLSSVYAKANHFSIKKAYFAGFFHDLTKNWTNDAHRQFLKSQKIDETQYQNYELHSLTASIWLKNIYQLQDLMIIDAVKKHTTLDLSLTLLDKIVFAADKLCHGRKWQGIQAIRELMLKDFDLGFKTLVALNEAKVIAKNGSISLKQKTINDKWKN